MTDLLLEIETVTDMDLERAAAVGRAFDADPELRPRRVGGDPARIRVEDSLEALIRRSGLPIDWLTVRTNSRRDGFEGGEIVLRPGRGGFMGWPQPDGTTEYHLVPNRVHAGYLRDWTDAEPGRLDRVAALFGRLCDALDACYGIATVLPRSRALPPIDVELADVGWLNFFGPAFVERWPGLVDPALAGRRSQNGGILIRVADEPWQLDAQSRQPVIGAIGPEAFERGPRPFGERSVRVPSYDEHIRFSPGTDEMPWVSWLRERDATKVARSRERRYERARAKRIAALDGREVVSVQHAAEWSASFDADDWRAFGRRAFRRLGGDLAGPVGTALLEEVASAPVELEESVAVATDAGPAEVRWFIDDTDTVDIYFFGPPALPEVLDGVHARWSEA
jgi:hypothetical protein